MPVVGDPAPPIVGTDLVSGSTFDLSEQLGKVVLVVFSGPSWCPPCQFENPHLGDLWTGTYQAFPDTRFVMCCWLDSSDSAIVSALNAQGVTFPALNDPEITTVWGIDSVPHVFIVDEEGNICAVKDGAGPPADALIAEIEKMLNDCGAGTDWPPNIPDFSQRKWWQAVRILFGIIGDGGGLAVTPGGKPIPIDPWGPLRPSVAATDALIALATVEYARSLSVEAERAAVQASALAALERATQQMRAQLESDQIRGPDRMSAPDQAS